ncbi:MULTISPECIES: TaqI-like C-terminal specificity domain-containing protein [Metasolibacillus]|uniref:Eco57I restriction-modification methylase domain-containing protein n=1 Tax=Metasolibacillus TaxID=2703677 RepID=UPI000797439F|nr:TaqI-like C-terminal specificity domain-containing protein [Metasolibacillus fluoroglycofenilyticus]KYG92150.1 hypothetical protein A0U40_04205 [[Bacillus] sp. KCTC 13219]
MVVQEKELESRIMDSLKFKKVFNEYYAFFKHTKSVNIVSLLPTNIVLDDSQTTSDKNILEFFIRISLEINSTYTIDELKQKGQFFTSNIDVVKLIINNIIDFKSDSIIDKKILEPSCGTGIFILMIIQSLFDNGYSKNEIIKFVNNNIIGFDISNEMVFFTKLNIYCLMSYLFEDSKLINELNPKVFVTDTTFKPENKIEQMEMFNSNLYFVETEEAKNIKINCLADDAYKFDYVLGNPPYITLYGRRSVKKSEEKRNYYIDNYKFVPSHVKNGKFNMTMFFFEQSIDWLKENGSISFIVDVSLFETAYKYLRKYIIEKTKIKYLIIDLSTFDGVGSGQVIISLQKNSNLAENLENKVTVLNYETGEKQIILQKNWYEEEENKFSIIDHRASEILKKIEEKSVPLLSIFPGKSLRTCTMLLDMEDRFTYKEKIETPHEIMPYYVGSKSLKGPFSELSFDKYFVYNKPLQDRINDELKEQLEKQGIKNKKRIGLGQLEVYKSPKIFIRQSAKQLIATLSFETAAANNSLYCLSEMKDDEISVNKLKVTCAQLNSTILTFYSLCKRIIRISKGKQPQIKVGDLKQIRLTFDENIVNQLLEITDEIISNTIETSLGIEQINNVLFDYYGINEAEKKFIFEHIEMY